MRDIDGFTGQFVTKSALRPSALVLVRPGELRHWEWAEISTDGTEWRIPAAKMKMGMTHVLLLSLQARALIDELRPHTGQGKYLFPGLRR